MAQKNHANILVISDYSDYHSTRPEAEIFKGLSLRGYKIFVMTSAKSKIIDEFLAAGMIVIDFHPIKKYDRRAIEKIRNFIQKNKIQVLHLFNNKAIINGIQAAKRSKVQVVLYRGYSGNISWWNPLSYLKFLNPRVDMITCNSLGVEEYIQKQSKIIHPKTVTINKGHKLEWYSNIKPINIREELNLPKDSIVLVTVSNNRRMKGIPVLLKAFNNVNIDRSIHLLLIGKGHDNRTNLKIIRKGNKVKNVHILGFRKDVLNIVSDCNAFILPSIKGESITKSVIEAMALGIPAIISDIPGNKELVNHMESGLIFKSKDTIDLKNKIEKICTDIDFRVNLGKKAQEHISKKLSSKNSIEKMSDLYQSLLDRNKHVIV